MQLLELPEILLVIERHRAGQFFHAWRIFVGRLFALFQLRQEQLFNEPQMVDEDGDIVRLRQRPLVDLVRGEVL